jgi:hypothetical protein
MQNSQRIACLMGLALVASTASAQDPYHTYDGRSQDGYYSDSDYNNDNRYDDRYGDQSYGDERYRDDRNGYRQVVRCESRDHRTVHCGVDIRGGVRMVNQISDRRCVRGRTWGTDNRGIWVSDGCRASFQVNARNRGDERYGRVIRCESRDSRTVYCNADSRSGVRLVRQLSSSPCVEGRSWGIAREGVWVSRGCRAEFRISDHDSGYGYRDN